ncbi:MAG: polysaccharide deacetylase family protein [Negativicutes bacterium]|nr:polysaccharide deacetylase family protein [Negativicutes bacterium]
MAMTGLAIKKRIAQVFDAAGMNDILLSLLNRILNNNYVRIINYHHIFNENTSNFEKHLQWYTNHFENCDYQKLVRFLQKTYSFKDKPGIMITFDDGFADNYLNAYPLLQKYGFTGYYFVSTGLVGQNDYMNRDQLKEMIKNNHIVGCHTYTHHRMAIKDSNETMHREIVQAKTALERILDNPIDFFCWVGGEENTYTKNAVGLIKNCGYKFALMTNSEPVLQSTDTYQMQRTNINDDWDLSLIKFQLSGIIDLKYKSKRERIKKLTRG